MIEQTDQEWLTILDDAALGQIVRNDGHRLQGMAKAERERRDAAYLAMAEEESYDLGQAPSRELTAAPSLPLPTGRRIESACYCGASGAPCEGWVAQNAMDRLQNLEYLACGIFELLRLNRTGFTLSHIAEARVEGLRLQRLTANMQICGVEYLSYAPCCDIGPIEKALVGRLSEIVAVCDDPEWIKNHQSFAKTEGLDIYQLSKKRLDAMVTQYKAGLSNQQTNTDFAFDIFGERIRFEMQPVEWEIRLCYGHEPPVIKKSEQFDGYWSIGGEAFEPPADIPNAYPILENGISYWQSSPDPMDGKQWEIVRRETQQAAGDPERAV